MSKASREIAGLLVTCAGILAVLIGLLPQLVTSPVGYVLLAGMLLSGLLLVISMLRDRLGLARALLATTLIAGVSFGVIYGVMWFFMDYLPSTGEPIIKLGP